MEFIEGLKRWYGNYLVMMALAFVGFLLISNMGLMLPRSYMIGILLSPIAFLVADAMLFNKEKGILFRSVIAFLVGLPFLILIPIGYYAGMYESPNVTMLDVYFFIIAYLTYAMAISFSLMIIEGFNIIDKLGSKVSDAMIIVFSISLVFGITYVVASINEWGYVSCYL